MAPHALSVLNFVQLLSASPGCHGSSPSHPVQACQHPLQVEAAYDILLMQSLSRRRSGQVVDSVKYADVRKPKPAVGPPPAWVQALRRTTTLTVAKPDSKELATKAAVFGVLAAWTYAGGLGAGDAYSQYGSPAAGSDVPGLQLALGVGASVYFLRKDNVGLGTPTLTLLSLSPIPLLSWRRQGGPISAM